jgi:hypothetical protein
VPASGTTLRPALRFEVALAPTAADWDNYEANLLTWDAIPVPQGLKSDDRLTRQVTVHVELQLWAGDLADANSDATTFFGSAGLAYVIKR